jgi:hypothetical protein
MHGLSFISTIYDHEPPDLRTTWRHFLKGRNKASFLNLQASLLLTMIYTSSSSPASSAPFWWLLLHLDMLILPLQQYNNEANL